MLGSKVLAETPCILNEEQKGCVKESFGCKEQLVIDTIIREQARKNNRNIYTAFIDYKKAYDSALNSYLLKILTIYKNFCSTLSCVNGF
jgi:predicted phosphoadenosine phosphosulfate sulfurtransferase